MTAKLVLPATIVALPPNRARIYDEQAAGNSGVISTQPCTFLNFVAISKAASGTLWIQFFDSATVPADATVPNWVPVPIVGGTMIRLDLSLICGQYVQGFPLTNGLAWAASTTAATKTVDATSSLWVTAQII